MNRILTVGLAMLLTTTLLACNSGSSSSSKSKTQSTEVNPLAKGELPTKKTTLHAGHAVAYSGSPSMLTLDPETKTFTYEFVPIEGGSSIGDTPSGKVLGTYDPTTGMMTATDCSGLENADCEDFNSGYLARTTVLKGDEMGKGLVVISPEGYYGVSRTEKNDMPQKARIFYEGNFAGTYVDYENTVEVDGEAVATEKSYTGKVSSVANFNIDVVKSEFKDFTMDGKVDKDMSAKIRKAKIDGNQFVGGQMKMTRPDGTMTKFEDVMYLNGEFFGNKAEEIGGVVGFGPEDGSFQFDGAWNGAKK